MHQFLRARSKGVLSLAGRWGQLEGLEQRVMLANAAEAALTGDPLYAQLLNVAKAPEAPPVNEATTEGRSEPQQATQAACVWVGASGGQWDDPANWNGRRVPGPADDVLINIDGRYDVNVQVDAEVRSLTLGLLSAAYMVVGSLHEETRLAARYGAAYERYRRRVPFLAPFLPPFGPAR